MPDTFLPFDISIHALREEGDFIPSYIAEKATIFLSTPSARRATAAQNIGIDFKKISIHALREEGDAKISDTTLGRDVFLSTPSARRATRR